MPTFKTTVIMVAGDRRTDVFRSVGEVPAYVRKRIRSTAERGRSATILIADERGSAEIARAVAGKSRGLSLRVLRKRNYTKRIATRQWDRLELLLAIVAVLLLLVAAFLP